MWYLREDRLVCHSRQLLIPVDNSSLLRTVFNHFGDDAYLILSHFEVCT
jgi:hypothetical protein